MEVILITMGFYMCIGSAVYAWSTPEEDMTPMENVHDFFVYLGWWPVILFESFDDHKEG